MTLSNCLVAALVVKARDWSGVEIRFVRNRSRRWHCIWIKAGERYEFYAKGRSTMPYWRNLLYRGEVRRIGT